MHKNVLLVLHIPKRQSDRRFAVTQCVGRHFADGSSGSISVVAADRAGQQATVRAYFSSLTSAHISRYSFQRRRFCAFPLLLYARYLIS